MVKSRFEFLDGLYLPGYMGLKREDYSGRSGAFDFMPTEPSVTRITNYLTPRGAHIFISQASWCVVEHVFQNEGFEGSVEDLRELAMEGRMKIVELNQKYRREVGLDIPLQGRMNLTNIKWGRLPMIKMDFDIANGAVRGNLVGVLAPRSVQQTNVDMLR